jgi:hypothetical protein
VPDKSARIPATQTGLKRLPTMNALKPPQEFPI